MLLTPLLPARRAHPPTVRSFLLLTLVSLLVACGGGSGGDPAMIEMPTEPSSFIAADPGPGFDYALGMDSFADGSTVVCGWFSGEHTWEAGKATETTREALASSDGYVSRYDPAGNLLWVRTIIGADYVQPDEVVGLSDGSCVVMGSTENLTILAPDTPQQTVIDEGNATFVARYLVDGTLAWVRVISGTQADIRHCCRFPDDSVGFCGRVSATAVFGAGEANQTDLDAMSTAGATDFVARYAINGDLVYAVAPSDSPGATYATGLTALVDGSAVVTGFLQAPATFAQGTQDEQTFTPTGLDDAYVARISPTGTPLWARHLAGAERELPTGATTLPNGNIGLIGSFTDTSMTLNAGESDAVTLTSTSSSNTYVCVYTPLGGIVWSTYIRHGPGAYLNLAGVVALPDNALAIVGIGPELVTVDPDGPSELPLPAFNRSDLFIARYDSTGALDWARRDGGLGTMTRSEGAAAYPDGSIGFAGGFQVSFTIDQGGPGQTTYPGVPGGTDTLLVRYNADGSHDGS